MGMAQVDELERKRKTAVKSVLPKEISTITLGSELVCLHSVSDWTGTGEGEAARARSRTLCRLTFS